MKWTVFNSPRPRIIVFAVALAISRQHSRLWSSEPKAPAANVTYNRDIAPIVYQYCAACHRPGEAGPFPLLTYQDVKKHGHQIVAVTQTRFMPPWLPEPEELKFADERRLSDQQIARIRAWVDQGMLEKKPSDLPPKPKFAEGWQLGQPDLILKADKPYMLQATGTDQYWNVIHGKVTEARDYTMRVLQFNPDLGTAKALLKR